MSKAGQQRQIPAEGAPNGGSCRWAESLWLCQNRTRGAAGRAILVRGTTTNLPAGQVGPSAVAENAPLSNRRGRRAKRGPLMDRGGLERSQSVQEDPRAGGCQRGGSANLSARPGLPFYRRRKCTCVDSKQPPRSERPLVRSTWLGPSESGSGEAEGWCWSAGRGRRRG